MKLSKIFLKISQILFSCKKNIYVIKFYLEKRAKKVKKEIKKQIEKQKKKRINYNWIFKITIMAFVISLGFSALSESIVKNVDIYIAIIILIIFIALGILFDMIGVAVTSADEEPFHSMSSRKVKGASQAVLLKKC